MVELAWFTILLGWELLKCLSDFFCTSDEMQEFIVNRVIKTCKWSLMLDLTPALLYLMPKQTVLLSVTLGTKEEQTSTEQRLPVTSC